jgi:hypothetical protein
VVTVRDDHMAAGLAVLMRVVGVWRVSGGHDSLRSQGEDRALAPSALPARLASPTRPRQPRHSAFGMWSTRRSAGRAERRMDRGGVEQRLDRWSAIEYFMAGGGRRSPVHHQELCQPSKAPRPASPAWCTHRNPMITIRTSGDFAEALPHDPPRGHSRQHLPEGSTPMHSYGSGRCLTSLGTLCDLQLMRF